MDEHVIVDFNKIQGPVYTGRARGEALRAQYQLDQVDDKSAQVDVIIPDSTYTVSSSFFLGLFGPSVVKAGSVELFKQRFHFRAPDFMASIIDDHASKALQGRTLLSH